MQTRGQSRAEELGEAGGRDGSVTRERTRRKWVSPHSGATSTGATGHPVRGTFYSVQVRRTEFSLAHGGRRRWAEDHTLSHKDGWGLKCMRCSRLSPAEGRTGSSPSSRKLALAKELTSAEKEIQVSGCLPEHLFLSQNSWLSFSPADRYPACLPEALRGSSPTRGVGRRSNWPFAPGGPAGASLLLPGLQQPEEQMCSCLTQRTDLVREEKKN